MLARLKNIFNPFRKVPYYDRYSENRSPKGNSPYSKIMHRSWKKQFKATFKAFNGDVPTILDPSDLMGMLFEKSVSEVMELSILDYLTVDALRLLIIPAKLSILLSGIPLVWSLIPKNEKGEYADDIHRSINTISNPFLRIGTKILLGIFGLLMLPLPLALVGIHMIANGVIRPALSAIATVACALFVLAAIGIANLALDRKAINRIKEIKKSEAILAVTSNTSDILNDLSPELLKNGIATRTPEGKNQSQGITYTFVPRDATSPISMESLTNNQVRDFKGVRFFVPAKESKLIQDIDALNELTYLSSIPTAANS